MRVGWIVGVALCAVLSSVAASAQGVPEAPTEGTSEEAPQNVTAPTAPVATAPVATPPVTTAPVATAPVTTAPVTTAPVATAPVTTAPVTSAPVATAPSVVAPEVEARQLFVEAVTAIQDGRHNDAIVLLERARALHEVPAVVYNLGLAHRGAGHYVEAAQTLERYVALAARRLDDARRVEVERLIAEARSRTALVTVTVVGTGVLVTMDGEPAPSELLRAPTRINPGRHVLRATAPGHRPHEVVREIGSGENVRIELAPERENVVTAIRIGSSVADADVLIDRIVVAAGSYESRIRPGRHEIEVRARGYQPFETVVVVMPGQFVQLQARLVQRVPWTGHWWIWAGMALPPLAGAAVLTGVMLSDTEPPTNTTTMTNLGVP